jgi:hypothetical protein
MIYFCSTLNASCTLLRVPNTLVDTARFEIIHVHPHSTILHKSLGVALPNTPELQVAVALRLVGAAYLRSSVIDVDTVVTEASISLFKLGGLRCCSSEKSVAFVRDRIEMATVA